MNTLKFTIVGNSNCGKTSILARYFDEGFSKSTRSTIGIDFKVKRTTLPTGAEVKIQIWDTAGMDVYRSITRSYYRGASGIIFVYDVTDRSSFLDVEKWMSDVVTYCPDNFLAVIVGNKIDCDDCDEEKEEEKFPEEMCSRCSKRTERMERRRRMVSKEELQMLAKKYHCRGYECSALTDVGIKVIFDDLVQEIFSRKLLEEKEEEAAAAAIAAAIAAAAQRQSPVLHSTEETASKCC